MTITNQGSNIIGFANPTQIKNGAGTIKANPMDKQISFLQEQMDKLNKNKSLDDETKKSKIKELQEQIKEIEEQKRKQQSEEMKNSAEPKGNPSTVINSDSADGGVAYSLTKALVSGSEAIKNVCKTNAVRVDLINEIRIKEGDVDSKTGTITAYAQKEGSKLQQALAGTTESLGKQISEAQDNIEKSNAEIAAAMQIENEKRNEENKSSNNTTVAATANAEANAVSDGVDTASIKDGAGAGETPVTEIASNDVKVSEPVKAAIAKGNKVKLDNNYKKRVSQEEVTVDRAV